MPMKLYGFSKINSFAYGLTRDLRVLWALEEMGLQYEIVGLDHPAGELNTDEYRRINPFEQIPVLDDDGVIVTESGAILIYLAKKSGKLIAPDAAGEAEVVRWCFAALDTVELCTLNVMLIDGGFSGHAESDALRQKWVEAAGRFLRSLDGWLAGREFIAAKFFTIADILMALVLSGIRGKGILEQHPNALRYVEHCQARPAWAKVRQDYFTRVEKAG